MFESIKDLLPTSLVDIVSSIHEGADDTTPADPTDCGTSSHPDLPTSPESNVLELAKDWSSTLFQKVKKSGESAVNIISEKFKVSDIGANVLSVVDKIPVLHDFQELQTEFAAEQLRRNPLVDDPEVIQQTVLLPWHPDSSGLTDQTVLDNLRTRILSLSEQPNTFLLAPPTEANVDDSVLLSPENVQLANLLLSLDSNLSKMRYELVPARITENLFWRNYFYRVSGVRQSFQLAAMTGSGLDDFVCFDNDGSWDIPPQSEGTKAAPTVNEQQSLVDKSSKVKKPRNKGTPKSSNSPVHSNSASVSATPSKDKIASAQPDAVNHPDLTADELLEAELAREVNEIVLVNPSDAQTDELDRELEMELLAELDDPKTTA